MLGSADTMVRLAFYGSFGQVGKDHKDRKDYKDESITDNTMKVSYHDSLRV